MTKKEKENFKRRMAKGKAKAARKKNPRNRLRNPKVGGVDVKPATIQGLGIAVGAYFGGAITGLMDRWVVSRLPAGIGRAVGFGASGISMLILGEILSKRVDDLPVRSAFAGASVPMWLKAFRAIGWLPTEYKVQAPVLENDLEAEMDGRRRKMRGMRGTIQPGRLPGSMMATIQPGKIPGSMMGSPGRFGDLI